MQVAPERVEDGALVVEDVVLVGALEVEDGALRAEDGAQEVKDAARGAEDGALEVEDAALVVEDVVLDGALGAEDGALEVEGGTLEVEDGVVARGALVADDQVDVVGDVAHALVVGALAHAAQAHAAHAAARAARGVDVQADAGHVPCARSPGVSGPDQERLEPLEPGLGSSGRTRPLELQSCLACSRIPRRGTRGWLGGGRNPSVGKHVDLPILGAPGCFGAPHFRACLRVNIATL